MHQADLQLHGAGENVKRARGDGKIRCVLLARLNTVTQIRDLDFFAGGAQRFQPIQPRLAANDAAVVQFNEMRIGGADNSLLFIDGEVFAAYRLEADLVFLKLRIHLVAKIVTCAQHHPAHQKADREYAKRPAQNRPLDFSSCHD